MSEESPRYGSAVVEQPDAATEAVVHELKSLPHFFEAVVSGEKTFEIRKDDRGFQVGHVLRLNEYSERTGYTGRCLDVTVTYMTAYGQSGGFVVLGIKRTWLSPERDGVSGLLAHEPLYGMLEYGYRRCAYCSHAIRSAGRPWRDHATECAWRVAREQAEAAGIRLP